MQGVCEILRYAARRSKDGASLRRQSTRAFCLVRLPRGAKEVRDAGKLGRFYLSFVGLLLLSEI
jgi:hypothetical protein